VEKSQRCVIGISVSMALVGAMGTAGVLYRNTPLVNSEFEAASGGAAASYAAYFPNELDFEAAGFDTAVNAMPTVTTLTLTPTENDGEIVLVPELDTDYDGEAPDLGEIDGDGVYEPSEEVAAVIETEEFQTVAVTWPSDLDNPEPMLIRVRDVDSEEWGEWIELVPDLTGPEDALVNTPENAPETPRVGSEAVYVGASDAVEIAPVEVADDADAAELAEALEDVQVVLVSSEPAYDTPTVTVEDAPAAVIENAGWFGATPSVQNLAYHPDGALQVQNVVGAPTIIPRSTWGAQPPHYTNGQGCSMGSAPSVRAAVIHHTAGSNNYANPAQAMQQIRNDQAYHISMNWCDLGYNFVVDKWGNVYEGRAGSINSAVIGAHAAGFNTGTVGITMLGNYVSLEVPAAQVNATGQVAGWVLGKYGVNPTSSLSYYTQNGSSKYKAGSTVTVPAIMAHRDVQATACPGERGYAQMTNIRNAAKGNYQTNSLPTGVIDSVKVDITGARIVGWTFDPDTLDSIKIHTYVDGVWTAENIANNVRHDVGQFYNRAGEHKYGFDILLPIGDGVHNICVNAINFPASNDNPLIGCNKVTGANRLPVSALDITAGVDGIRIGGWAFDPDSKDPIEVRAYVDGNQVFSTIADLPHPWVAATFGLASDKTGFNQSVSASSGVHNVCVWAINVPAGPSALAGCKTVSVTNRAPIGALDVAAGVDAIRIGGWAFDPDSKDPIEVRAYVDGNQVFSTIADIPHPWVAATFGLASDKTAFNQSVSASSGVHNVCVWAINVPAGPSSLIGCQAHSVGVVVKAPVSTAKTVSISDLIAGTSQLSAASMASYVLSVNPNPNLSVSVERLAQLYIDEGARLGVRGDIAFAQAIKETGWFKYGGQVKASQNNYAGIGATTNGTPATFKSAADGVRAQIEHLYAYASKNPLPSNPVDPRFSLVTRGIAPRWQDLNGRWAVPGTTYAQGIIERYNAMLAYTKR